jgi:hypothetical protein
MLTRSYLGYCRALLLLQILAHTAGVLNIFGSASTFRVSAQYEDHPQLTCRLWCGSGGKCNGGWTKGLLLVENSMTHQAVTLLHRLKTSSS